MSHSIPIRLEDFLLKGQVALLMWDMQNGLAGKSINIENIKPNAHRLIQAADALKIPVFWSRHVLPPLDLISGPFKLFLMKKQKVSDPSHLAETMREGGEDVEFLEGFKPAAHHIVIEKSQPSLFVDTSFDLRLKTLGVKTLVIAGVATDIGVEFNCRHAAALGYYSVVVEDACGSYTQEAHDRSIDFLRSWITQVVSTQEVLDHWR